MSKTSKTLAYIPLHYGSQYLDAVIKSIKDSVDEILILYTSNPSFGHKGQVPNPDSEELLRSICEPYGVTWLDVSGNSTRENTHRSMAYQYGRAKGYDMILAVDSDEIWQPETVNDAIQKAKETGKYFNCISGNNWLHFWKNYKEVNIDGFYPMRIINLRANNKEQSIIDAGRIYHMGYAISDELMSYKLSCHGHKSEIPVRWFKDKWLNYEKGKTTHLHPASRDIWIETQEFKGEIPCIK